jgi:intraflagellar transport protein 57
VPPGRLRQEAVFSELDRGNDDPERLNAERKVLESSVDPVKWKTELERVSSRLKVPPMYGGKEWREHMEQTKKNEEMIQSAFPDTRGQLVAMSEDLKTALERLGTKEKYINSQFDALKSEYGEVSSSIHRASHMM